VVVTVATGASSRITVLENARAATAVVSTGFWLTVLGATALLVTLAYWGVYQLGI
jgi:hypothetical protein